MTFFFFLLACLCLAVSQVSGLSCLCFLPSRQCQGWAPSCGRGLKFQLSLVGYSHKFCMHHLHTVQGLASLSGPCCSRCSQKWPEVLLSPEAAAATTGGGTICPTEEASCGTAREQIKSPPYPCSPGHFHAGCCNPVPALNTS